MDVPDDFAGLSGVLEGEADRRPPLVLLHGLTFDRAMWLPALAELRAADSGRQVLALDLPGHGGSPVWPSYDIESLAAAVHGAVEWTRLEAPVVVGHSMAALIATRYAARYPVHGVVNVDQWLRAEPFLALVKSLAGEIRGGGFAAAWQRFEESMHMEALPASARRLLRPASSVRQDVVAGYWREGLDRPARELAADIEAGLAKLRANGTRYLFIAGHEAEPEYQDWLNDQLPQAAVEAWPGSGHFPHLAHPARFAGRLAATGRWPAGQWDGAPARVRTSG
jgi:pimeloyl-ACP methyl ester carboxylesterase